MKRNNPSDRGASMVEYALLVALIAVVCLGAIKVLGEEPTPKGPSASTVKTGMIHDHYDVTSVHLVDGDSSHTADLKDDHGCAYRYDIRKDADGHWRPIGGQYSRIPGKGDASTIAPKDIGNDHSYCPGYAKGG